MTEPALRRHAPMRRQAPYRTRALALAQRLLLAAALWAVLCAGYASLAVEAPAATADAPWTAPSADDAQTDYGAILREMMVVTPPASSRCAARF